MNIFSLTLPNSMVDDQSVQILDQITGVAKYMITGNSNQILDLSFTEMMRHFNEALLGFGLIIFAILLFVGTMNTAADGQFLGRNWNSVWTPVRLVLGILFVVPLQSGFCVAQYIFLYLILVGVNIGTYVWNQVVEDVFNHYTPPAIPSYVSNYAQQAIESQMILASMTQIVQKFGGTAGQCEFSSNPDVVEAINQSYGYLSRDYQNIVNVSIINPMWTPLAFYQQNYFPNALPPALKKKLVDAGMLNNIAARTINDYQQYISQTGTAKKPLGYYDPCVYASTGSVVSAIDVDTQGVVGSLPTSVVSLIYKNSPKICGQLFSDKVIQGACRNAIDTALRSGDAQNGQPQTPKGGAFDGKITVWVGDNYPESVLAEGNEFDSWDNPAPNGKVKITGRYDYVYNAEDKNAGSGGGGEVANDFQKDLQAQLLGGGDSPGFIPTYIMTNSNGKNLCLDDNGKSTGDCSFAALSNEVIALAQANVEKQAAAEDGGCKEVVLTDKQGHKILDAEGHEIKQWECPFVSGLQNYEVNGMPKMDPKTGLPTGEYYKIQVPLEGSWWNAGEAYLILDDHFAKNLQVLIDAIQQNTSNLLGNASLSGNLKVEFGLMVMEAGEEYQAALSENLGWEAKRLAQHCIPINSDGTYSTTAPMMCGLGSMMLFPAQTVSFETKEVSMADLSGTGTWGVEIAPYNPDLNEDEPKYKYRVQGTTQAFYNQLLAVPSNFQVPIQMILMQAGNASSKDPGNASSPSAPGCRADKGNCYQTVYPYLLNIINTLAANGLLNNQEEALPINQAMNSMFTQLLGAEDANDPRVRSINSVMQDVYNFGVDKSGDIVSQQFSLIQQIRDTGIGMIVTCLGSMEAVYTHYRIAMDNLISSVNSATKSPEAYSAQALAGSATGLFMGAGSAAMFGGGTDLSLGIATGLGFLAQSANTASQILQSQVELSIATTTITTMSNIGIQLMWLPLFLFIMTSLFTAGVQFALVIPFMPYIMFWAGQIAWVIGVLEALIAAPLVMLAFAHPGGSEHLGHAGPAVRFLIGVIFRPVLMVIGLITGILLTYILIHYSADGFHIIASSIFSSLPAGDTTLMGVMSCLLLFTYASFLVMAFTKCFSPIYLIPEKVVQWINGHADQAGAQESQQFGSNVQQTAQQGAQAGGQTLQSGIQAQEKRGQGMSDLTKQNFAQGAGGMGVVSKTSEGAGQGASSAVQFANAKRQGKPNDIQI